MPCFILASALPGPATGRVVAEPTYLHWGVVQISLANLLVIVIMVVLFALALVLPFPGDRKAGHGAGEGDDAHR
jgi:hypothetical protein